jgi:hypothetical protein
MKMWYLGESAITELTDLRETGMGFQLVEAMIWGKATPLLVFNSERAVDLSQIELLPGDDPATILRNGLRVIEVLKSDVVQTVIARAPAAFFPAAASPYRSAARSRYPACECGRPHGASQQSREARKADSEPRVLPLFRLHARSAR